MEDNGDGTYDIVVSVPQAENPHEKVPVKLEVGLYDGNGDTIDRVKDTNLKHRIAIIANC